MDSRDSSFCETQDNCFHGHGEPDLIVDRKRKWKTKLRNILCCENMDHLKPYLGLAVMLLSCLILLKFIALCIYRWISETD